MAEDLNEYSVEHILNRSYDKLSQTLVFQQVGTDGQELTFSNATNLATKIIEDDLLTYVCVAAPGTGLAAPKWQCRKINESSGTVVTWADGNANFDNDAIDPTGLTYS